MRIAATGKVFRQAGHLAEVLMRSGGLECPWISKCAYLFGCAVQALRRLLSMSPFAVSIFEMIRFLSSRNTVATPGHVTAPRSDVVESSCRYTAEMRKRMTTPSFVWLAGVESIGLNRPEAWLF